MEEISASTAPSLDRSPTGSLRQLMRSHTWLGHKSRAPKKRKPSSIRRSDRQKAHQHNPKFYLKHFSADARRYWWRKEVKHLRDVRIRLYKFFEEPTSKGATLTSSLVVLVIVAMLILMVLNTHFIEPSDEDYAFFVGMIVCNAILSVEVTLRMIALSAPVSIIRSKHLLYEQLAWLTGDILATGAFWLQVVGRIGFGVRLQSLDILGALRVFRVLHAVTSWPAAALMVRTLMASSKALLISFVILGVTAFFFGACLYYTEREMLVKEDMAFPEMTMAIWFMLVTFSTVGYGDVSPMSYPGRAVTVVAIFFAVTFMAMPITIVGNNFQNAWEDREKTQIVLRIQKSMLDQQMSVEDVVGIFHLADTSGDGAISYMEFIDMLRLLGIHLSTQEGRRVYRLFDEDGNGSCSYDEFVKIVFPTFDVEGLTAIDLQRATKRAAQVGPAPMREQSKVKKTRATRCSMQPPNAQPAGADGGTEVSAMVALVPVLLEELRALASSVNGVERRLAAIESGIAPRAPAPAAALFGPFLAVAPSTAPGVAPAHAPAPEPSGDAGGAAPSRLRVNWPFV
jgi:hypothetical protein